MTQNSRIYGPVLILDHLTEREVHLAAIFLVPQGEHPEPIEVQGQVFPAEVLAEFEDQTLYRSRFVLAAGAATQYQWNGESYEVATDFSADLRIAYVSCNGEEHGDLTRAGDERNAMWARLCADHKRAPFSLLLHGGDQVYADEVTHGHPLSEDWPDKLPKDPARADLDRLRSHLRERFMQRYRAILKGPEYAWIAARVPSLMQWDDHDICDGWGSLRRSRTYSPVGQALFDCAREAALLFQHGCRDGDLPARFADPKGRHLGWSVDVPGLRILAPDLRSERTRRAVMGELGWQMMEQAAARAVRGRTFLMSSVPLLGPRLSLLEMLMVLTPRMQKYEDDLRDQWQSRAHRASWRRMLQLVQDMAAPAQQEVTALSGEIHLATRAEMQLKRGEVLHQLVASGVAHRAPPTAWARILGTLATWGDAPLPGHPIRIRRIPGKLGRYVAERNYLTVQRRDDQWQAIWEFEQTGTSPALPI